MCFNNIHTSVKNFTKVSLMGSLNGIPLLVEKFSNFRQKSDKTLGSSRNYDIENSNVYVYKQRHLVQIEHSSLDFCLFSFNSLNGSRVGRRGEKDKERTPV